MPEKRVKPKACRMWALVTEHDGNIGRVYPYKNYLESFMYNNEYLIRVNVTPVTKRKPKRK